MEIANSNIKNLFIAVSDDQIVAISSGLQKFVKDLKKIDSNFKSKTYYTNFFKENSTFHYQNPITGKKYLLHKIVNEYDSKKNK